MIVKMNEKPNQTSATSMLLATRYPTPSSAVYPRAKTV